ncbi:MAG: hypothetical protein ACLFMO_08165 [Eubacteriales bacterium]
MEDLIERIKQEFKVTDEQAIIIIRLLQSNETIDFNFWETMEIISNKRKQGKRIL